MAQRFQTVKLDDHYYRSIDGIRNFLKEMRQAARNRAQSEDDKLLSAAELLRAGKWLTVCGLFLNVNSLLQQEEMQRLFAYIGNNYIC